MKLLFILSLTLTLLSPSLFAAAEATTTTTTAKKTTTDAPSAFEQRADAEKKSASIPFGIGLFRPNYIFPFYYTASQDQTPYRNTIPDNQNLKNVEIKYQLSFIFPVWKINKKNSLNLAYTQLSYWQVYTKSAYFRETNYQGEGFWRYQVTNYLTSELGATHQSNGRGGLSERSWNRAYVNFIISGDHWFFSVKPWVLIFKSVSSGLHNPDITHYLGNGRFLIGYKYHDMVFSMIARNNLQSGFKRGALDFTFSFPIYKHIHGYAEYFSGYGQSLIEYNHYTNSVGLGITLNDWI